MVSTKIELNFNRIARIQGLDELAGVLFPRNGSHRKVFLAVFIEIKYAADQFVPDLSVVSKDYEIGPRMLETVRSKMRRMGIIDHVSRFNRRYGYREGWVFSSRFSRTLQRLEALTRGFRERKDPLQERKDRDLFRYLS